MLSHTANLRHPPARKAPITATQPVQLQTVVAVLCLISHNTIRCHPSHYPSFLPQTPLLPTLFVTSAVPAQGACLLPKLSATTPVPAQGRCHGCGSCPRTLPQMSFLPRHYVADLARAQALCRKCGSCPSFLAHMGAPPKDMSPCWAHAQGLAVLRPPRGPPSLPRRRNVGSIMQGIDIGRRPLSWVSRF